MEFDTKRLAAFKGGQIEIHNEGEGYLYRGEVTDAEVSDSSMSVMLGWLARSKEYPPTGEWVMDTKPMYELSTLFCDIVDLGDGRLMLLSYAVGERVVFFLPGHSDFDTSKIEGFRAASA